MMVACPAAAQGAPSGLSGVRGSARSLRGQTAEHLNSAGAVTSARGLGGRVIKEVPCEPPLEDECVHRRRAGVARGDPPRCVGRGFTEVVTEAWQTARQLGGSRREGQGTAGGWLARAGAALEMGLGPAMRALCGRLVWGVQGSQGSVIWGCCRGGSESFCVHVITGECPWNTQAVVHSGHSSCGSFSEHPGSHTRPRPPPRASPTGGGGGGPVPSTSAGRTSAQGHCGRGRALGGHAGMGLAREGCSETLQGDRKGSRREPALRTRRRHGRLTPRGVWLREGSGAARGRAGHSRQGPGLLPATLGPPPVPPWAPHPAPFRTGT